MKNCEVCNNQIPDSYINLLCVECYNRQAKETEDRKREEEELRLKPEDVVMVQPVDEPSGKAAESLDTPPEGVPVTPTLPQDASKPPEATNATSNHITDPNYVENPEMEDKEQVAANLSMFQRNGVLLWKPTRTMYEFIKNRCMQRSTQHPQYPKFIWKPRVVDVGCGSGVGANVISQEADFVWGIDKNEQSVRFAKEAFTRVKNGIYYNAQVSFDQFDIIKETRETMKFDIICGIEIIEHISNHRKFLQQIIKFDTNNMDSPSEYFISTPNRNNKSISKNKPSNPYHVKEFTSEEFFNVLSEFFINIKFYSSAGEPIEGITTNHTPLLARCWGIKK